MIKFRPAEPGVRPKKPSQARYALCGMKTVIEGDETW
jgi:hypothetical protein